MTRDEIAGANLLSIAVEVEVEVERIHGVAFGETRVSDAAIDSAAKSAGLLLVSEPIGDLESGQVSIRAHSTTSFRWLDLGQGCVPVGRRWSGRDCVHGEGQTSSGRFGTRGVVARARALGERVLRAVRSRNGASQARARSVRKLA
jgi:hypothetical protein